MLLVNHNVIIKWVKGHAGIAGNETADFLAKVGATSQPTGPEHVPHIPTSSCKLEIKKWVAKQHRNRWRKLPTCRMTREAVETPEQQRRAFMLSLSKVCARSLIQVLTGHGALAYHANLAKKVDSPVCTYCQIGVETPRHYMEECPAFFRARISCFGGYLTL